MLKIKRVQYSKKTLDLLVRLRLAKEVSAFMCEGGIDFIADNFLQCLNNPFHFFYFAFVQDDFAGVFIAQPLHWNSYQAHIMFMPNRKLRRHCIELGKMAIKRFWEDVAGKISHVFGYIPAINKPALLAVKKMGFKKLIDIPDYAKVNGEKENVELLMLRRN